MRTVRDIHIPRKWTGMGLFLFDAEMQVKAGTDGRAVLGVWTIGRSRNCWLIGNGIE
jgi:hypothetical protein